MSEPRPLTWPPTDVLARLIDTLHEYGNAPRAAARDPYLRTQWAALSERQRQTTPLALARAAHRPVGTSWHPGPRYARRLQRHAHPGSPPSQRTGLGAALVLVAADTPRTTTLPPPAAPHHTAHWLPQLLHLAVLGALIAVLARGHGRGHPAVGRSPGLEG